jgi:hypothetical protein
MDKVSLPVSFQLFLPKIEPGFWHSRELAFSMSMPEAPVHKDNRVPCGENQIRLSRKILDMKAITETHAMNETTQLHFRSRILAPNPGHALTSFFRGKSIHQILPLV